MPSPTSTSSEGAAASSTSKTPAPSLIGTLFVRKFYTMLSTLPDQLHRFYKEDSTFSYGTEGETIESFVGDQEINKKILSLGYKNTNVLIASLESQQSYKGGMIVLVSGSFNNESGSRQFTETFFLATQPAGFYVLNDIRVLKPAATPAPTENGVEPPSVDESETQAEESPETEESPKESAPETPSAPVVPATPEPAPAVVETPTTPTPAPTPAPAQTTPTSSPAVPPTPASTPATPAPATPSTAPTTPSQPATTQPAPSPAPASKPNSFLSAVQSGASASAPQASTNVAQAPKQNPKAKNPAPARKPAQPAHDPDASSVFVRNLPHALDQQVKELEQKLRDLFSHQGTIKNINTAFLQRGYCFVEFESPEIAQRCIKAAEGGHLQIDNKALMVEEKKTTPAVSKSDSGSKATGSGSGSRLGGSKPNTRPGDRTTGAPGTSAARRGGSSQGSDTRRPAKAAHPKQPASQATHQS